MEYDNTQYAFSWPRSKPDHEFEQFRKRNDSDHDTSLETFIVSLGTNAAVFVVFFSLFLIFRRMFERVYSPRTFSGRVPAEKQPDRLPYGVFSFLRALYNLSDKYILQKTSIDAYLFLRFLKTISLLTALATILTFTLLVPVNAAGSRTNSKGLNRISLSNISPEEKEWFYVHAAVAWLFFPFVCYTIYRELGFYIALRNAYVTSPAYDRRVSSRTLLVMNTPDDFRDDESGEAIRSAFDGAVKVWQNKDMKKLEKKVEKRKEIVAELEVGEVKYLQEVHKIRRREEDNRTRSRVNAVLRILRGGSVRDYDDNVTRPRRRRGWLDWRTVDMIEWECQRLYQVNEQIKELKRDEDQKRLSSAFIYFDSQKKAQAAYQSASFPVPCKMTPRYIGIHPEEVMWGNLGLGWWNSWIRLITESAAVFLVVLFWAVPVGFVATLTNIEWLTDKVKWLEFINGLPDPILGLVKGYVPTLALALLMTMVPEVFRYFAVIGGSPSRSHAELRTQKAFFFFQVVQVFLITTVSSSAAAIVTELAREPARAMPILAKHLPRSSNFYVSYVILQGLSLSSSRLLQISSVFFVKIVSPLFDNTPRKRWTRWTTLLSYGWGSLYPVYTNLAVIAVAYAVIAPLILPFASLGLAVLWMAYKYNFVYVYNIEVDTKGASYAVALQQLLTGVYVGELCLAGLFGLKGAKGPSALMIVLLAGTVCWHISMRHALGELLHYVPLNILDGGGVQDAEGHTSEPPRRSRSKKHRKHRRRERHREEQPERERLLTSDEESQQPAPLDSNEETAPLISMLSNTSRAREAAVDLITGVLPDIVHSDRDELGKAYVHPAVTEPEPVVWIPRDEGGVMSRRQVDEIRSHGLEADDRHAWLEGRKAKLVWEPLVPNSAQGEQVNPPDYVEARLL